MYKDKDKQREAQRERTRRYRAKRKGVTSEGVTQGVTQGVTDNGAMPIETLAKLDAGCGDELAHGLKQGADIDFEKCRCCGADLPPLEQPRKYPGACGLCCWSGKAKTSLNRPQPKAVKTFEDLPVDVQQSIEAVSADTEYKTRRTARAIAYQHLFPDTPQNAPD